MTAASTENKIILVDSNVVISWLMGDDTEQVQFFRECQTGIKPYELMLSPISIYECTVGIKQAKHRMHVQKLLLDFSYIEIMPASTVLLGVEMHHITRNEGKQNSMMADLILAGMAIALNIPLLTQEKWFKNHAEKHGLQVWQA